MKLTHHINIQRLIFIQMVEFLIDNIYVEYGGHVYQQTVGIPMGTNWRNMKIFCSEDLFRFESYWSRDILHRNFRLRLWLSNRHCSQIWHRFVTYVEWFVHEMCHMTGFQLFGGKSWRARHVGQEMLTLSGIPDFTPFEEFMIFHPFIIYALYITEFVSFRTMFKD